MKSVQYAEEYAWGGAWVCPVEDKDGNERFFGEGDEQRPDYCPLREVPKPKEDNFVLYIPYNEGFINGYNACIDEILGGGE